VGDLSPHFDRKEFACPHCGVCKIEMSLVNALEELRTQGPEPIIIHDGYRCPEHNAAVGGAPHSEHMEGIAADFSITGLTLQQMYDRTKIVPAFANGGIGVYDGNFIHADTRNGKARWSRKNGVYLGLDVLVNP